MRISSLFFLKLAEVRSVEPSGESTEPVTSSSFCSSWRVNCMSPLGPPWDVHCQVPVSGAGFGLASDARLRLAKPRSTREIARTSELRFMVESPCKVKVSSASCGRWIAAAARLIPGLVARRCRLLAFPRTHGIAVVGGRAAFQPAVLERRLEDVQAVGGVQMDFQQIVLEGRRGNIRSTFRRGYGARHRLAVLLEVEGEGRTRILIGAVMRTAVRRALPGARQRSRLRFLLAGGERQARDSKTDYRNPCPAQYALHVESLSGRLRPAHGLPEVPPVLANRDSTLDSAVRPASGW